MVEEDDRLYCAMKDALQDAGCETFGLFTAVSETLNAVPQSHIDVALIDLSQHDPRFTAVFHQLSRRGVPILLITERRASAVSDLLPARSRLAKPFTEQDLLDRIREAMNGQDDVAAQPGMQAEAQPGM